MNARRGQNFTFKSVKSAIGGAFVGGLLLPLLLGVLLQLTTGWRLLAIRRHRARSSAGIKR